MDSFPCFGENAPLDGYPKVKKEKNKKTKKKGNNSMKKLVTILLALAMIFAMSTTTFAEEAETFELTMNGIKNHTYKVFQIYTGDVSDEDGTLVLSNIKYGANHVPVDGQVGDLVPDAELQAFLNSTDQANYFKSQITGDEYAIVNADGSEERVTFTVAAGYYLIVDVTDEDQLPDGQTKSPVLLKVSEDTTIASKHASIVSEKKVDDKNDSITDEDDVNWQDAADYDIGDDVPFQLSVTLPSTLNTYDAYELTFHDDQAIGFNAPENVVVYIERAGAKLFDITSGYAVEACTSDKCEFDGCSFTVTVSDVNALYELNNATFADGDKVVVEYTAKLNDAATVGRVGNINSMYVCHPDGHTPIDSVTVLTYALKVNKIDGTSKEALEGAGFTLYKYDAASAEWAKVGDEIVGDGITSFTWAGIDGGKYKLVESTTPAGYNTIADIEFVIDATHKTEWLADGNSAFEDLIAKNPTGSAVVFADKDADGNEDGKLEGNIENYKGVVLPETGAQGTFFLIAGGALLVMLAAVFMITRKKMSVYED